MLVDQKTLEGNPSSYAPISWQSRQLPRICRSSTSAEIQTGGHAVDAHEFAKQTMLKWYNEHPIHPRDLDRALSTFDAIVVTDSKNLYDSGNRVETSGLQLEERRLALEVLSIRERTHAAGIQFRWVDSDQQLADNLSKPFAFNNLLEALQKGEVCIHFGSKFTSAKKKRAWIRNQKNSTTEIQEMRSQQKNILDQCWFYRLM